MLRPGAIGVDVVDIEEPRFVGKSDDERLLRRVFTAEESERIRAARDPDLAVGIHWAAKEAVFKAESVALGSPPVFRHADFELRPDGDRFVSLVRSARTGDDGGEHAWIPMVRGFVERPLGRFPVLVSVQGSVVALAGCVGTSLEELEIACGGSGGIGIRVEDTRHALVRLGIPDDVEAARHREAFTPEADRAHSVDSVVVRVALRQELQRVLAECGDPRAERVRIVTPPGPAGRTPPWAGDADGPWPELDVSISHHGRRIALAWRVDAGSA